MVEMIEESNSLAFKILFIAIILSLIPWLLMYYVDPQIIASYLPSHPVFEKLQEVMNAHSEL